MAKLTTGIKRDKQRGTYYFVVDASKPGDPKRKQIKRRGFKSKDEAEAAMIDLKNEIIKGTYIQPNHMLYKDFLVEWLESKRVKESTLETYEWLVKKHISPHLGDYKLKDLSPRIIDKFYNRLYRTGTLADSMIQKIHTMIKDSLKQAEIWEMISRNPADKVKRPAISETKEIQIWSQSEVRDFLKVAREDPLYICFLLALSTGMRRGEILALRWRDIDFCSGTITIHQTLSRNGKKINKSTKTRSSKRTIEISSDVLDALNDHKTIIAKQKKDNGKLYQNHDLIICTVIGTPINPSNLRRTFQRITKTAGVPQIRFHDLRHTHASLLLLNGVNIKVIQERLGHANVKVTLDTYSHLMPGMQKEAAEKISSIIFDEE